MANVAALLAEWGALTLDVTLCSPQNLARPLQKFSFAEAARWFTISGGFAPDCEIWLDPAVFSEAAFPEGVKTQIGALNPAQPKARVKIMALGPAPAMQIYIGGDDCRVFIGVVPHFVLHAMLWGGSSLIIGDGATCNGARTMQQRSGLIIGRDAMLSDEILLQGSQQHTLVDLRSMSALNPVYQTQVIGEHVWLGRRAVVMPGVRIGKGAVLAAAAVATRDIPACCVAVGVPAEVIRREVSWCRNDRNEVDAAELAAAGILPVAP